jgi:hypothetical protein
MATPTIAMIPSAVKAGKLGFPLPLSGDGDLDFTRASGKTRINESQQIETVLTGVPSIDYTGGGCPSLLLEPQQTQLYGETATMATQTKTVTAVEHTVGFYGTGTITFTGTYAGSLVGTGINDRVELTFTPTAGSLISTVSGSVASSQLVTGDYLGSYIPNTTTGTITRIADAASKTGLSSYINSTEGVLYAEIAALSDDGTTRRITISDENNNNYLSIRYDSESNRILAQLVLDVGTGFAVLYTVSDVTEYHKIAVKWKENDSALWVDGIERDISGSNSVAPSNTFNEIGFKRGNTNFFNGRCKDLRVYSTALTDTELTALTT